MKVSLRSLTETDVPLVVDWLSRPHVAPWWMQPAERADIDYLLASGSDCGFVIVDGGRPVGFIQAYNCYAQPDTVRDSNEPPATWGFDVLIGEASALRKGIASAAAAMLIGRLERDFNCTRLVIELPVDNAAGIALYESVGFEITATIEDLPKSMHLMARWAASAPIPDAPKLQPQA